MENDMRDLMDNMYQYFNIKGQIHDFYKEKLNSLSERILNIMNVAGVLYRDGIYGAPFTAGEFVMDYRDGNVYITSNIVRDFELVSNEEFSISNNLDVTVVERFINSIDELEQKLYNVGNEVFLKERVVLEDELRKLKNSK